MLSSLPQGGILITQIRLVRQEVAEIGNLKSLELIENAAKGVDSLPQTAARLSHKLDPRWTVSTCTTRTGGHTTPYYQPNLRRV
jgi:hypothetical protein